MFSLNFRNEALVIAMKNFTETDSFLVLSNFPLFRHFLPNVLFGMV